MAERGLSVIWGKRQVVVYCVLGSIVSVACKDKGSQSPASGSHQTPILCVRCEAEGVLYLPKPAAEESWPKECPSCKRWGAYPSGVCKHCKAVAPLVDARTHGFGQPDICRACQRPWEP